MSLMVPAASGPEATEYRHWTHTAQNAGYLSTVEVAGPVGIARLAAILIAGRRGHVPALCGAPPTLRAPGFRGA